MKKGIVGVFGLVLIASLSGCGKWMDTLAQIGDENGSKLQAGKDGYDGLSDNLNFNGNRCALDRVVAAASAYSKFSAEYFSDDITNGSFIQARYLSQFSQNSKLFSSAHCDKTYQSDKSGSAELITTDVTDYTGDKCAFEAKSVKRTYGFISYLSNQDFTRTNAVATVVGDVTEAHLKTAEYHETRKDSKDTYSAKGVGGTFVFQGQTVTLLMKQHNIEDQTYKITESQGTMQVGFPDCNSTIGIQLMPNKRYQLTYDGNGVSDSHLLP